MESYVKKYLDFKNLSGINEDTCTIYQRNLEKFSAFISNKGDRIEAATKGGIEEYLAYLKDSGFTNSSINQHITTLKNFYTYLGTYKSMFNPMQNIPFFAIEDKIMQLSSEEINTLKNYLENEVKANDRDRLILLLIIRFGFSGADILDIKVEDIRYENKGIVITARKVPFIISPNEQKLYALFESYLKDRKKEKSKADTLFLTGKKKPLTRPHVIYIFKKISKALRLSSTSLLSISRVSENEQEIIIDGRYKVIRLFKAEKTIRVYLAEDLAAENQRKVLKIISTHDSKTPNEYFEQLKREFYFLSSFSHRNLLQVFEVGHIEQTSELYITREYDSGDTLDLYAGKLKHEETLSVILDLLAGLAYIHSKNFLHYDIKPDNIIISRNNDTLKAKYADMGLSDHIIRKLEGIRGTIPFIAPEIFVANHSDSRSDIFSLGVTLYFLISGNLPFLRKDLTYINEAPQNLSRGALSHPKELCDIIMRMIEKNPEKRFKDVSSIISKIEELKSIKGKEVFIDKEIRIDARKDLLIMLERIIKNFNDKENKDSCSLIEIRGKKNIERERIASMIKNILTITLSPHHFMELDKESPAEKFCREILQQGCGREKQALNELDEEDVAKTKITLFLNTQRALLAQAPMIVVLNNFENGTDAFQDLILFILSKVRDAKILFVLFIETDTTQYKRFRTLVDKIDFTANQNISFTLAPFAKREMTKFLNEAIPGIVDKKFIDYLYSLTNGDISQIEEMVNLLIKKRLVKFERTTQLVSLVNPPDNLFDFTGPELFDEESRLLLSIISVYNKAVSFNLLRSVMIRLKSAFVAQNMSEKIKRLIERDIIQSNISGGISLLSFTGYLFERDFSKTINPELECEIHRAIAAELEELSLVDESLRDNIAHHLLMSKNYERAFLYLESSVESAESSGLISDALNYLDKIDPFIHGCSPQKRVSYLLCRMRILIKLVRFGDALALCEELERYDKSMDDEIKFRILKSKLFSKMGKKGRGLDEIERALDAASRIQLGPLHFEMIILKVSMLIGISNFKEAIKIINQYLEMDASEDARHKLFLSNLLALSLYYIGDYKKAVLVLDSNIIQAQKFDEIYTHALNLAGMIYYQESNFKEALSSYERAREILDKRGNPIDMATLLLNEASIYHRIGEFKRAHDLYKRAENIFDDTGGYYGFESVLFGVSLLYLNLGNLTYSLLYQEKAYKISCEHNNIIMTGYTTALLGDIKRCQRDYQEAIKEYEKAIEIFEKLGTEKELCYAIVSNIFVLLEFNEINIARENLARLNSLMKKNLSNDLSSRVKIAEIACDLKEKSPDYKMINKRLNILENDDFISSNWELKLLVCRERVKYFITIGEYEKARELSVTINNELLRLADGFDDETRNLIVNESEYGGLLREIPKIEKSRKFLDRLLETSIEITESLNLNRVLEKIIDASIELAGAERGYILLHNRDKKLCVKLAKDHSGMHILREILTYSKTAVERAMRENSPIITENVLDEEYLKGARSIEIYKIKSLVVIPLSLKRGVIGVLYMETRAKRGLFSEDDAKTFELFGNHAAIAIENARIHEELSESKLRIQKMNRALKQEAKENEKRLNEAIDYLSIHERKLKHDYREIIGKSEGIIEVLSLIDKIVESDLSVFIKGESGTGKELIARAIHYNGKRKNKIFIAENCAGFTETLLESALFGHKKGSFTDAKEDQKGIFEVANGGTVFLDEIGDMSPAMQKKLLRFLQNGEFRRIGDQSAIRVDVRIISATHRDLKELIKRGVFREDLYYRLNVFSIDLPPLRKRIEDIPYLVSYFIERFNERTNNSVTIEKEVIDLFCSYTWPGNIRELQNEIQRLIVMRDGNSITSRLLHNDPRFAVE